MLQKILSIAGAAVILTFVGLLIRSGSIVMPDYWTQLAVGLTLLAIGLLSWGFKPEIMHLVRSRHKDSWIQAPRVSYEPTIEYKPTQPDFVRPLQFIDSNIRQMRFRVKVWNNSPVDAKKCKATLILKKLNTPNDETLEFSYLIWDGVKEEKNIRAKSYEWLLVIFSDSRITGYAMACKLSALFKDHSEKALQKNEPIIRKYAFDAGDYEAQLIINALHNISTSAKFKIHVANNFDEVTMERIE